MKNLSAGNYALATACRFWLRDEAEHEKTPPTPSMKFGNAFHRGAEKWILDGGRLLVGFDELVEKEGLVAKTWAPKLERRLRAWIHEAHANHWERLRPEMSFAFNVTTGETRALEGKGWRTWQGVDRTCEATLTIDGMYPDSSMDVVDVYDWKTGRVNAEKDVAQIRACSLAAARFYNVSRAVGHVVYVEDDSVHDWKEGIELDEFDMLGDQGVLERIFRLEDSEPKPGTHCRSLYCAAREWCEKKRGL